MRIDAGISARRIAAPCLLFCLLACEEDAQKPAPEAAQTAAAVEAPTPEPVKEEPKKAERPKDLDPTLTDERRSRIEAQFGDAKGFVVAKDIEDKLKENKAIKEKEAAVKAFDRMAKDKWVLFTGPAVNLTDKGFDLGVVYTPQLPNDPMGMSRQFFEVTFNDVEGYEENAWKVGTPVSVLAKYQGKGIAGPGYELVAKDVWK